MNRIPRHLVVAGAVAAALLVVAGAVLLRHNPPTSREAADDTPADQPAPTIASNHPDPAAAGHDELGAAMAAVANVGTAQRWLYWTDAQIVEAIHDMATANTADQLATDMVASISEAREHFGQSTGRVWWLVHPLAWKVDAFTGGRATVHVWTLRLISATDVAVPQTEWATITMDLEWENDSWRLAAVHDTPGPTPMVGPWDEPWQPEPFDTALDGFTRLDGEPVIDPEA